MVTASESSFRAIFDWSCSIFAETRRGGGGRCRSSFALAALLAMLDCGRTLSVSALSPRCYSEGHWLALNEGLVLRCGRTRNNLFWATATDGMAILKVMTRRRAVLLIDHDSHAWWSRTIKLKRTEEPKSCENLSIGQLVQFYIYFYVRRILFRM